MTVWAVVVAAGSGSRFGGPKQFASLLGKPLAAWSVDVARSTCDGVVLVLPADELPAAAAPEDVGQLADRVVAGGATRSASVRAGLAAVPAAAEVVVVHDGARPLATPALFERLVAAVRDGIAAGAVPALPLHDTVKRVLGDRVLATVARQDLVSVQTPQAFTADVLRLAHAGAEEATDDAALVEGLGLPVRVVAGEPTNLKVTVASDLSAAEAILAERDALAGPTQLDAGRMDQVAGSSGGRQEAAGEAKPVAISLAPTGEAGEVAGSSDSPGASVAQARHAGQAQPGGSGRGGPMPAIRIGQGFDVHPFDRQSDRPLVLGGVTIPGEPGLIGHSDADVVAHALADAVLGAAGRGDIGSHFPADQARWAGVDSVELLRRSGAMVLEDSWRAVNAQCTVVCERPRLAGHLPAMAACLSAALGAPVSVTAKRAEGLGSIGRVEGIACLAVVLLAADGGER